MTSIKTIDNKFNLINNRVKYGTDNGILVDTRTLIVNNTNNCVGINTLTPTASLDISSIQQPNFFNNITNTGYTFGDNTQILTDIGTTPIWTYNQYNLQGNNFLTENTVDLSGFSYFDSTGNKFAGGVLAPNGKIYCIPYSVNYVAIIDPVTRTVDTTSIRNVQGGRGTDFKWYGGVLAPNGKIYCIPLEANNILVINTFDNTTSYITGITVANYPTIVTDREKWIGGAIAPNGKIYCSPYFAQCVLIIDTTNDTVNLTDISGIVNIPSNPGYYYNRLVPRSSNVETFGGAVLHPNGKIYFVPAAATGILQIDPTTNTPDASSYIAPSSILPSLRFKYFGGCLGPDYNIYVAAWNADKILRINVTTDISSQRFIDVSTNIPLTINGQRWQGLVCGQNGKIYGIPFGSSNSVIIDPVTNFANQTTIPVSSDSRKYSGGVLAPDGVIYCIPRDASRIMTIKTSLPTLEP